MDKYFPVKIHSYIALEYLYLHLNIYNVQKLTAACSIPKVLSKIQSSKNKEFIKA